MPIRFHPRWSSKSKRLMSQIRRHRRPRYRKYKRRTGKQRYNKTKNVLKTTVGRSKKNSLYNRVAALEVGSKKHSDYVSLTPELVVWNGTDLNPAKNSYSTILAIQGPLNNGVEGNPNLPDNAQRKSDTIHCSSVRLKGTLRGVRPNDLGAITDHGTMSVFGSTKMQELCHTKFTISILQDMRASIVNPTTGDAQVNALPSTAGAIAIETLYADTITGQSQLQFFGTNNALKSYEASRFKLLHQECVETSFQKPNKQFDINYKVNRKLKYVPPRTGTPPPPNAPSLPYNYGLVIMITCVTPPQDLSWATVLSPPQVTQKSARTYFIDA